VYQEGKKIKLPEKYKDLVNSGYQPFMYEADFEDWILEKSKKSRVVIEEVGDYGASIRVFDNGKEGKEITLKSIIKGLFIQNTY